MRTIASSPRVFIVVGLIATIALKAGAQSGDPLEARVRQLEEMVRFSAQRQLELEARLRALQPLASPLLPTTSPTAGPASDDVDLGRGGTAGLSPTAADPPGGFTVGPGTSGSINPLDAGTAPNMPGSFNELLRGATAGLSATAPDAPIGSMPAAPLNLPLGGTFGNGFELKTEDDEYVLQFHNLTQFDGRFYLEGTQRRVRDSFVIPRQWFIFNGRVTKPIEYFVAFAEGFDSLNLLDSFLNFNYDKRMNLRFGRFKTPFTYEFYAEPIQGLLNLERSLFFNNFAINRDVGIMPWGRLFDERLDYAVGIFNGTRNAFTDTNDEKDFMAFLNYKPWSKSDNEGLKLLQFGGSVDLGQQNNPASPMNLRVNVATNGTEAVGVEFLRFNDNVREVGFRNFWTAHLVWFYQQLSLIAEYGGGYQRYAFAETPYLRGKTPVQSFYVQAGYFLTGETVEARGSASPLRPFDIRKGKWGPGAIELAGRYNYLDVGDNVFRAGFADRDDWTNRVQLFDLGINWYLTRYLKIYAGWERAVFATPVLFATDGRQIDSDLFWFRTQIYF